MEIIIKNNQWKYPNNLFLPTLLLYRTSCAKFPEDWHLCNYRLSQRQNQSDCRSPYPIYEYEPTLSERKNIQTGLFYEYFEDNLYCVHDRMTKRCSAKTTLRGIVSILSQYFYLVSHFYRNSHDFDLLKCPTCEWFQGTWSTMRLIVLVWRHSRCLNKVLNMWTLNWLNRSPITQLFPLVVWPLSP